MNHSPYTYLIGWSKLNVWYYGVRFAKRCHPSELWVTYFTSSKVVKTYRSDHGEPDIVEIRKTFNDVKSARNWETKVLKRLKVISSKHWLNQTDNIAILLTEEQRRNIFTDEVTSRMSEKRKKWIAENREKALEQMEIARKSAWKGLTPERSEKISCKLKNRDITWGSKISKNHKESKRFNGANNPMYGRSAIRENNLKWYTNGSKIILVKENTQPLGFIRGRKLFPS
jgi:hypothetical protein